MTRHNDTAHRLQFNQLSAILLAPQSSYAELFGAVNEMYTLLGNLTGFEFENKGNKTDIWLTSGRAIGPSWAAMCLQDFMRTHKFMLGLHDGIVACRERFPNQTIHVLYAGTGPFATLMLPLTTTFKPEDVQFTLLEINPLSIGFLRNTITALQLEPYVRDIIECDATTIETTAFKPYHLVVTETMQNGLKNEPQVPLTINMLTDLEPEGILVPEKILIQAGLFNPSISGNKTSTSSYFLMLKEVMDVSIPGLLAIQPNKHLWKNAFGPFPEVVVQLPESIDPVFNKFCLFTTIQTFGNNTLELRESGLTQPQTLIHYEQLMQNKGKRVGLQYALNRNPVLSFMYWIDNQ